jgi:hypothetical protein
MAGGEFVRVDPLPTARMILGLLLTHATWCERRALYPRLAPRTDDEVFAEVMEFCLRSLSRPPGPDRRSHVG